ncbi:MAG TPA: exodeoxyribonuclease VII small subunit [Candidatus Hydrogenedentes bacterium]|nr:exodeoxyribonuclease VII small subunit [Candidatus Hydrogenedentota bacterium]
MAQPSFEKDIEKLESLVAALEEGGLSLDAALKHFEEGVKLAQRCEKALTDAEKKIEMLTKNTQGDIQAKPMPGTEADDDAHLEAPPEEESDEDADGGLLF